MPRQARKEPPLCASVLHRPADVQAVVDLSLRAWTPVFASLERILGRVRVADDAKD